MFNQKTQIYPFGLDSEAYGKLSENRTSGNGDLATLVILFHSPRSMIGLSHSLSLEAIEKIQPVIKQIDRRPMAFECPQAHVDPVVVSASSSSWRLLSSAQKAWLVDDVYVQVGFARLNATMLSGLAASVATSMTLYDYLAHRHHTVFPENHEPVELSGEDIRTLRLEMGDYLKEGATVWSNELMQYRNKVAIMCRAALAGNDPVDAYHDFLLSSRPHFLGFEPCESTDAYETFITSACVTDNDSLVGGS